MRKYFLDAFEALIEKLETTSDVHQKDIDMAKTIYYMTKDLLKRDFLRERQ